MFLVLYAGHILFTINVNMLHETKECFSNNIEMKYLKLKYFVTRNYWNRLNVKKILEIFNMKTCSFKILPI